MISFSDKAALEGTMCILYLQTTGSDGLAYYAYLAMKSTDLPKLKTLGKRGSFRIEELGEILASGQGEPTDDTKRYIEDEYGLKPDEAYMFYTPKEGE